MSYSRTREEMVASIRKAIDESGVGPLDTITVVQRIAMDGPVHLDFEIEVLANFASAEQVYERIERSLEWIFERGQRPYWLAGFRLVKQDARG